MMYLNLYALLSVFSIVYYNKDAAEWHLLLGKEKVSNVRYVVLWSVITIKSLMSQEMITGNSALKHTFSVHSAVSKIQGTVPILVPYSDVSSSDVSFPPSLLIFFRKISVIITITSLWS